MLELCPRVLAALQPWAEISQRLRRIDPKISSAADDDYNATKRLTFRTIMSTKLAEEAKKLSIPERIALVEEIWDSIAEDNGCFELTEARKQELDRRLESLGANPSQGRTWEEIKLDFLNFK